jgi:NIPSNAP
MIRRVFFSGIVGLAGLIFAGCASQNTSQLANDNTSGVYELRIYTINPGKKDAMLKLFRERMLPLFKKHDIESIGYWLPVDQADQRLHFLLHYSSRKAREIAWKSAAFAILDEPDSYKARDSDGPFLAPSPECFFLQTTDFSPAIRTGDITHGGVFELRTYTTPAGLLPNLDARFRDHTIALFARHGINSYAYFHRMADQPDASVTLQYLVTHRSVEAATGAFADFGKDPEWIAAKKASEEKAGGSLTVKDGVKRVFLAPVDFSPTK